MRFIAALLDWMWSGISVPTAKRTADWIEANPDRPPDWENLCRRLRAWPDGRRYPPIPDNDSLTGGARYFDPRWWLPGEARGPVLALAKQSEESPESA
jgi:hypothetical protein